MLSRFRIGTRLAAGFALLAVLAGVTGGVGFIDIRAQATTAAELRALTATADDAQQMQFLLADVTGWQAFEGVDVAAQGASKALQPSSQNVKGFVADKSAIYSLIAHWHRSAMTAGEAKQFASIPRSWDAYFSGADRIEKLWRDGSAAAYVAADVAMNTGFNSTQYQDVFDETSAIRSSIDKRRSALESSQASESLRAQLELIVTILLAGVVAVLAAAVVTRSVVKPLRRCVATLRAVASGDLTARAQVIGSDELAELATELNQSTENTGHAVASMGRTASDLAAQCDALALAAGQGTDESGAANLECVQAAAGTNEVAANITGIASSTDQMRSAISEISLNAAQAASVAHAAVASAEQMNTVMNQLGDASSEISDVVKLIAAIAGQTNLLALNATIEAARAGEAGKGFAVVASEVKELAQQTRGATENISHQVHAMQNAVAEAVAAIEQVGHTIDEISDFQTAIASAVDQQTATTSEINRSVLDASDGASNITQSVGIAAQASLRALDAIRHVGAVTTDVARLSTELQAETRRFTHVD